MDILTKIRTERTFFDGGTGTLLQKAGLPTGAPPECWNIEKPEVITALHEGYLEAGCDIIKTNTFGANALKLESSGYSVGRVVESAVSCARLAVSNCAAKSDKKRFVALDIGPTGKLLSPLGDLGFERAVELFSEPVRAGVKAGADLILIETMSDTYELKAAVLAAKENSSLPVFATVVFDEKMKMLTGADPAAVIALLEGLRVDALGINCSLGPDEMKKIVPVICEYASIPVIVNPNAGLPVYENGEVHYPVTPSLFASAMADIARSGASITGGCCGTTPEHIRAMIEAISEIPIAVLQKKNRTLVSSGTHAVEFGGRCVLIGERINPTGKKKFKEALREGDIGYIINEGVTQAERGADILDVNVGLPEIDEKLMMTRAVRELQAVCDLPLQIDTTDSVVMEAAMRMYNGKPLVNSVNGKRESMDAVFPLVAKYGGAVIALTLDEDGIPETAEGRFAVAKRIINEAERYGIGRNDIIVDPLALTISADRSAASVTLDSLRIISEKLGVNTSLGVSNISFGLPARPVINASFFTMALENGLSAAIVNPYSAELMNSYYSYDALRGCDENCERFIAYASRQTDMTAEVKPADSKTLRYAIEKGLCGDSAAAARLELENSDALAVIDRHIIPALDEAGRGFEAGRLFLPQLLMSAQAAKSAFEVIKASMPQSGGIAQNGDKIVLATVQGDIHDIGKNIVRVLLENYGFHVIDLGRDAAPDAIVEAVLKNGVRLVGLSALMTTTVVSMEKTIKLLREKAAGCLVMVGGAVLTQEYADMIGADFYGHDAMESVRYARRVFNKE